MMKKLPEEKDILCFDKDYEIEFEINTVEKVVKLYKDDELMV